MSLHGKGACPVASIQASFGHERFNQELRQPMRSRVMEAVAMRSIKAKDSVALTVCADIGTELVNVALDLQHLGLGPQCGTQVHLS